MKNILINSIMTTGTISQDQYMTILKSQKKLDQKVNLLRKVITRLSQDEISSRYVKKLNSISSTIDKGKGIKFSSAQEMQKYLNIVALQTS